MTEIGFYQLLTTPLEAALPKLLEKAVGQGLRAVVAAGSSERAEALDAHLWTYANESFLPHGRRGVHDASAADQPVWLTTGPENPNGAGLLVLLDGQIPDDLAGWNRVCDMFDGGDEDVLAAARARWKTLKAAGHTLTYWRQTASGGWEKAG